MNIYDITVKNSNHQNQTLRPFEGKVLLIINSATKCGYTKQYDGLQKLYDTYKNQGFEILDFPSNQFMGQAPGDMEEIKAFCELNFNTTFPLFEKIKVNGLFAHPLFKYLKANTPMEIKPTEDTELKMKKVKRIKWNFTKFLVNQKGEVVYRFSPAFKPEDIAPYIESLLAS